MRKPLKPISQYRGPLSPQQVADGMNAAARNANRLLDDATVLLEDGRFPTACSVAILSIEESGKLSIFRAIAGVVEPEILKSRWRDYRNHQMKNVEWIIGQLATKGARVLDDLRPIFDPTSDHPAVLDIVKQLGFYTDCYGKAHWSEPQRVVDEKLAKTMVFIAKILLPKREVSSREVELWIEHVVKYWGTAAMRQGAINFHKALINEGLCDDTLEEIESFYLGRPVRH
jgi:AbiV family abortive infection protein